MLLERRESHKVDLLLRFLPDTYYSQYNTSPIVKLAIRPIQTKILQYFTYRNTLPFIILKLSSIFLTLLKKGRSMSLSFYLIRSMLQYTRIFSLNISQIQVKLSLKASRLKPIVIIYKTMQNIGRPSKQNVNFFLQY